jgi:hypothetical protein
VAIVRTSQRDLRVLLGAMKVAIGVPIGKESARKAVDPFESFYWKLRSRSPSAVGSGS